MNRGTGLLQIPHSASINIISAQLSSISDFFEGLHRPPVTVLGPHNPEHEHGHVKQKLGQHFVQVKGKRRDTVDRATCYLGLMMMACALRPLRCFIDNRLGAENRFRLSVQSCRGRLSSACSVHSHSSYRSCIVHVSYIVSCRSGIF